MKNLVIYRPPNHIQISLSIAVALIGFALSTQSLLILPIGFLGVFMAISRGGFELDNSTMQWRDFSTYLFIKTGKWKSLKGYTGIIITSVRIQEKIGGVLAPSIVYKQEGYKVMLVNKTHLRKLMLFVSFHKASAINKTTEISKYLSIPIVKYNPQISEATKRRKR